MLYQLIISFTCTQVFAWVATWAKLKVIIISIKLQAYSITLNFIHSNQLEGIKQHFIIDASIYLIHLIWVKWIKNLYTSILVFNIAQFFPFLNHQLLLKILSKIGFDPRISLFFSSYLINKQTQYIWNYFISLFFKADVGVGQRSTLSSILSSLYVTSIFHIFEKRSKNLLPSISVSILSFVDNELFISQKKSYEKFNMNLFYSYSIISSWFKHFGLVIEHDKSEVFHFSRLTKNNNPPLLDLQPLGGSLLYIKDM